MKYNETFFKQRAIAIVSMTIFVLAAIVFIPLSYASEQVKAVQGIIEHISNNNNNITVNGRSYDITNASIMRKKGYKIKKIELESGLKVTIYLENSIVKKVIVFDKNIVE